ncbi:hypothetical protein LUW74_43855 [Actinomadura madurae]|uniref:hypothetical protein n=1 Tax=Actinomadura madurae TaxID=1993 RepID=UPI0020264830|nr:hypothetical protein [Actinomadura madurae]URN09611.1 hypothetical protein LUW74_43855 [Actinomadura madurae]
MTARTPTTPEGHVDARSDDRLTELLRRMDTLERHILTLTTTSHGPADRDALIAPHSASLRTARAVAGLAAVAEQRPVTARALGIDGYASWDLAGDLSEITVHPDLARFLGVPVRTRVASAITVLARRMMRARPVSSAGRHKLLALAEVLERLCTETGMHLLTCPDPVRAILLEAAGPAEGCGTVAARDLLREEAGGARDADRELVICEAQATVVVEFLHALVGETPEGRRADEADEVDEDGQGDEDDKDDQGDRADQA